MKKYKLRLPLIAAALMLVVELVLLISCYGIAIQTKRHLSEEDFDITGFRIQQKAENRFAAAETVEAVKGGAAAEPGADIGA